MSYIKANDVLPQYVIEKMAAAIPLALAGGLRLPKA